MMTELILVEGVSDVQLISYYLQNVYGWKHERENILGIEPLDEHEHIESLSKNGNQVVLCGVGGNGKFAHFVEQHRINYIVVEKEISSLAVYYNKIGTRKTLQKCTYVDKLCRIIEKWTERLILYIGICRITSPLKLKTGRQRENHSKGSFVLGRSELA